MQDTAIAIVNDLNRSINSTRGNEVNFIPIGLARRNFNCLTRFKFIVQANIEHLGSIKLQTLATFAFSKLKRQDTHTHKITAMNTLKAGGNNGFDSQQEAKAYQNRQQNPSDYYIDFIPEEKTDG